MIKCEQGNAKKKKKQQHQRRPRPFVIFSNLKEKVESLKRDNYINT